MRRVFGAFIRWFVCAAPSVGLAVLLMGVVWGNPPLALNVIFSMILGAIGGTVGSLWALRYLDETEPY